MVAWTYRQTCQAVDKGQRKDLKLGCGTQLERERSAKPLCVGLFRPLPLALYKTESPIYFQRDMANRFAEG